MRGPVLYVSLFLIIYMMLLFARGIMDRVRPRPGSGGDKVYGVLRAITDPYLVLIRQITPPLKHGTVDWAVIVGVTILAVAIMVLDWLS
jgi:uncharacterized protein YggT (Ycf19 family)